MTRNEATGSGGPGERRAGVIRVLLVDDHALLRAGMARLLDLADDVSVVGSAGSGVEGLEMAAAVRPDVVLMDLRRCGCTGAGWSVRRRGHRRGAEPPPIAGPPILMP